MRESKLVKICPVCHKAFTRIDNSRIGITCSVNCGVLFAQHDKYGQRRLLEMAQELKREPKTDCCCYANGDCTALTALWCVYEDCAFYKKRGDTDDEGSAT